jgi:hypothetical protein
MTNYSKNENVNVSVGFRVCSRYCYLKSVGRTTTPHTLQITVHGIPSDVEFLSVLRFRLLHRPEDGFLRKPKHVA